MSSSALRLGTRGSALARWQANWVAEQLRARGVEVELVPIVTRGDVKSGPLGAIGGEGLFTKEIQRAILAREVDLGVHSLKDLPTDEAPGLCLAAVPERASSRDVLVAREASSWDRLREGAVVGTGSLRRRAQLWHRRPDLWMEDVRGNVETRLRKLEEGQFDALILAEAGLARLGLAGHVTQVLANEVMLPAVGQGALGIETRADDASTREIVAGLDHPLTHAAVAAERALLAALRAGCLAPVGAIAQLASSGQLQLAARVLDAQGKQKLEVVSTDLPENAVALGVHVATTLLDEGAARLIESARGPRGSR